MGRRRAGGRETVDVDTAVAVDRFLSSPALSEATRRAYAADLRDFTSWLGSQGLALDDLDVRVLAAYTAELGRARRGLAPTTIARRLSAVRSLVRHALGPERVPDAALAPRRPRRLPETPALEEVESAVDRAGRDAEPLALRNAAVLELAYSCGLRSAEVVALDLGDVDLDREHVHVRGKGGKERLVPLGEEAAWRVGLWLRDGRPALVRGASDALFLSVRGRQARHERPAAAAPQPSPPPSRVRDAPARGRRRPPDDPGAPRPRLALDDADLQPRRRTAPAAGLRPRAPALVDSAAQEGASRRRIGSSRDERPPRPRCRELPASPRGAPLAAHGRRVPARPRVVRLDHRPSGRRRRRPRRSRPGSRRCAPTGGHPRRSPGGSRPCARTCAT